MGIKILTEDESIALLTADAARRAVDPRGWFRDGLGPSLDWSQVDELWQSHGLAGRDVVSVLDWRPRIGQQYSSIGAVAMHRAAREPFFSQTECEVRFWVDSGMRPNLERGTIYRLRVETRFGATFGEVPTGRVTMQALYYVADPRACALEVRDENQPCDDEDCDDDDCGEGDESEYMFCTTHEEFHTFD